jgi:hypothetical protein
MVKSLSLFTFHIAVRFDVSYRGVMSKHYVYSSYNDQLVKSFVVANDDRNFLCQRNSPKDSELLHAVIENEVGRFHALLLKNECSAKGYKQALFFALGYSRSSFIHPLMNRVGEGIKSVLADGMLTLASFNGDLDDVKLSLSHGADPRAYNSECLKQAYYGNHLDIATRLYEHGASISALMEDPIFMAKYSDFPREAKEHFIALYTDIVDRQDQCDLRMEP